METILRVESLKKHYGKEPNITKALNGISFQVVKGEFLGIMGSSGSGKTTLLNCLATIIKPTDGSIQMQEKDLGQLKGSQLADYRGKEIGYLFQNFELLDNLTAKENILLPLSLHKVDANESKVRLELLSQYLDISELLDKFPSQLSGGQRQRVAAARALILDPKIVFADEPTGALDSKNATILMQKLSEMNQVEETTILMVTHDSVAASFCNRILFIQDGKLFHEIRRDYPRESQEDFYHRILKVMSALAGGDGNVF
ncbi:ABC transporter [Streptococcus sp. oral taxon 431]|jgi:bacitracin export ATP-binding protein bceA|uniref:Macrolide ABC superfamily ATP binding cassette transporter, ABC protein n=1 Tax=Streptococcus infantis SPAR10 TaxID=1159208 RepID=J1SE04_9STRE|nr:MULTISPECIES: ABC transporter ATP-binding protein [Streptococcus]AMD96763.1 ABC transporter [Streptococcus sp. oral taxon 431]EJG87865.1 macrolide ABC superfamily ATP binding cassette transporter, ABC protein [Streptococcus infantis SPAR10]OFK76323.1 ABC transporter [Streptococcus sp. HMSC034E03]OFP43656.1 ABC transporter [Streptococcus sp. HMSC067H01]WNS72182.1 ABC transporter ATP-binding protein [Streptococcus sp. DTU_2020_1001019_1_SI_AUS_MUR_006]